MLIVIEGTDGSGKATQTELLSSRFKADGKEHITLDFPRYTEPSSALIKAYLSGEFGTDPEAVNPFSASTFYAVDRIASYLSEWKQFYLSGGIVLADRYTTSNATHQGSKFKEREKREEFFEWLSGFEYGKLGLPSPDLVIFLDVPVTVTLELMQVREVTDIHEANVEHLIKSKESALHAADFYGWQIISCVGDNGKLRTVEAIHADVWEHVRNLLHK